MNKVSLIISTYNCAEYLEDCFNSILNQTIDKNLLDVIIINDGSTDNSLEIIKKYTSKYNNWHLIDQKNSGLSISRNNGLDFNKNEYVMFLDSDDELPKDAILTLYNKIETTKGNAIIGGMENYNSTGVYDNYTKKYLKNIDNVSYKTYPELLNFVHAQSKIYRTSIIKNIRFIKNVKHEDVYFTNSVYLNSNKLYMIDEIVYRHRIREGENKSITQSLNLNSFKDLLTNYKKVIDENQIDYEVANIIYRKAINYVTKRIKKEEYKEAKEELNNFYKYINSKTNFSKLEKLTFELKNIFLKLAMITYKITH